VSANVYVYLHLTGLVLLFFSLGGLTTHALNGGDKASNKARALLIAFHGVAMLLLLVAGFGAVAKLGYMKGGMPGWVIAKIVIWLLMGAAPVLIKKKPELAKGLFFGLAALGSAAAYIAGFKPF
jgi:hypothetical protein